MDEYYESQKFLASLLDEIGRKDALHSKKLKKNIKFLLDHHSVELNSILSIIYRYFSNKNSTTQKLAEDYLKMVNDMRHEGLFFLRHGKYSCENQAMAFEKVYSNPEIMSYYMNALLISQILWKHHFSIFTYFYQNLNKYFKPDESIDILDIGPGHGFFSEIIKARIPNFNKLDIVDISESSLNMTKEIIGTGEKINYFNKDIFDFDTNQKYNLIVLGEVIEHLDNPLRILRKISKLLTDEGILWLTTPTNAPALDHIYLFKNKEDVTEIISAAGLNVVRSIGFYSEDVSDEEAKKKKVTQIIGVFCNLQQNN